MSIGIIIASHGNLQSWNPPIRLDDLWRSRESSSGYVHAK